MTFVDEAERRPELERELPRFLAGIWQVFNEYEIAGYVASQRSIARKRLRRTAVPSLIVSVLESGRLFARCDVGHPTAGQAIYRWSILLMVSEARSKRKSDEVSTETQS
jgi:hypothetical protein